MIQLFKFLLISIFICSMALTSEARKRNSRSNNSSREPAAASNAEEGDDAYDPFADYSEFEYESDEQADINFFRNGRMLNIAFTGGYNMCTGTLGQKVQNGIKYGFNIAYFFDLRFAMQFSYLSGDYPIAFTSPARRITGVGTFTTLAFDTKYYFNTQNVTRGFAKLNPYMLIGFANQYKTLNFVGVPGNSKQAALGFDVGVGIEIPFMRKKMFWGGQVAYHHTNFKDAFTDFVYDGDNYGNQYGDQIDFLGIVGINF